MPSWKVDRLDAEGREAPFGRPTGGNAISNRLIADVLLSRVSAQLALHVATPDEPAVALLCHVADPRLITPAATQQSTPVQPEGRSVAYPSSRAGDAESGNHYLFPSYLKALSRERCVKV